MLSTRNSSILMVSSSENLVFEAKCSFTKYASLCPSNIYVSIYGYVGFFFLNEGVSDNTCESGQQILNKLIIKSEPHLVELRGREPTYLYNV